METYNINGVEIQYDTFDLVNLELYTNGVTEIADVGKRVKEMIQEDPAKNGIKAIRMMCNAFMDFFDVLCGEGTSKKCFGDNGKRKRYHQCLCQVLRRSICNCKLYEGRF